jgi:hypothetical protein
MTVRRMRISRLLPKATHTHTHTHTHRICIVTDFPLHQWLHDHASMLRYTYSYIACLVFLLWFILRCCGYSKLRGMYRVEG